MDQPSDHILEMRSITKTFPGVKALQDVTLEVRRGEVHAICGENGAGKSTLMRILSGHLPPTKGSLHLNGQPITFSGPVDAEAHEKTRSSAPLAEKRSRRGFSICRGHSRPRVAFPHRLPSSSRSP